MNITAQGCYNSMRVHVKGWSNRLFGVCNTKTILFFPLKNWMFSKCSHKIVNKIINFCYFIRKYGTFRYYYHWKEYSLVSREMTKEYIPLPLDIGSHNN